MISKIPKSILDLPDEILKEQISRYLCFRDVSSFQSTCSQIETSISLKIMHAVELQPEPVFQFYDRSNDEIFFKTIDPILFDQSHTILFTCDFKDQGWGNRKGFLYIKELDNADRSKIESSGRTICSSHLAEHQWTKFSFEFMPQIGKVYSIWYKVGGGGGHELCVKNAKFRSLVYDPTGVFSKLANADFCKTDVFCQNMFMSVVDTLSSDLERKVTDDENSLAMQYPHFVTLFKSIGLILTDDPKQLLAMKTFLINLGKIKSH